MRIDKTVNLFITDDTAQECVLFGQKDTRKNLQRIDGMQRVTSGKLNIAASGTESIPLGDVDAVYGVSFASDRSFNVIFNGGVESVSFVLADADPDRTCGFTMEATLSAVSITNADATNALSGTYVVWGDPTP